MKQERWLAANALFEEIIELPSSEQAAALERARENDPAVGEVVARLLRADAEADGQGFLRHSPHVARSMHGIKGAAPGPTPGNVERLGEIPTPERLGPYRILQEIGRGGMGTIYAAARDDDTIDQKVAIKVIRAGTENEDIVRRMRLERRILARLQHPNIARIYDAGSTDSGLPYFVMELVEGLPIDQYCAWHGLDLRGRLELIRRVCQAVEYANENLVVHRDIKPSNILVTADGEPKLLDFGIAKVLEPDPQEVEESGRTEPWQQRMTLEYASPEHIRGLPVSISCDVYSLGVLLFLLLTGEVPRSAEGLTPWLFDRQLRSTDPPRPSQLVAGSETGGETEAALPSPRSTVQARQLSGDLDSIVLGALQDDPRARYSSAKELGDDLERYLGGFPVVARHGSATYRFGKLLRRHFRAVTFAVVVLGLASALLVSVIQSGSQATRDRALLQAENTKRQELLGVFLGIFEQARPLLSEGVPLSLREAVDRYVDPYMEGAADRFTEQPDVRAEVLSTLGWIYLDLGDPEKAHSFHDEALTLRRGSGQDLHSEVESLVGLAAALREQWRLDEARALSNEALAMAEGLAFDSHQRLRALNHHVDLLCKQEDWQAAEPLSHQAFLLSRDLSDTKTAEVTIAWIQRAMVFRQLENLDEARDLYLATRETLEGHYGPQHPLLALLNNNLGGIAYRQEHFEQAIEAWTLADRQYAEVYGEDFYNRILPLNNLGRALLAAGKPAEAESALRRALQVALEAPALKPRHERRYFGTPAVELAELLITSGRCPEVLDLLEDRVGSWKDHKITRKAREQVQHCRAEGSGKKLPAR